MNMNYNCYGGPKKAFFAKHSITFFPFFFFFENHYAANTYRRVKDMKVTSFSCYAFLIQLNGNKTKKRDYTCKTT